MVFCTLQKFFNNKNNDFIQWLKHQWNINYKCVCPDIDIQGSPERTLARVIFQDRDNSLFLLEKFSKSQFQVRQNIAKAIEYLNKGQGNLRGFFINIFNKILYKFCVLLLNLNSHSFKCK